MAYQVKIEKVIGKPVDDVFTAIKEGRLFINCSADSNLLKIDFRVGGKYRVEFKNHGVANWGEFLEIVPNKKLVFTWCQKFGEDQKPDTQVTIELFGDGRQTRLVLVHDGFHDKANCDGHYKGWNGGLDDLADELVNGRLRMLRLFDAPVEKVFDMVKNPASLSAFKGQVLEAIPNEKLVLSVPVGKVTINLAKREKGSSLELIHEGLTSKKDQMAHRQGWDTVTVNMSKTLVKP